MMGAPAASEPETADAGPFAAIASELEAEGGRGSPSGMPLLAAEHAEKVIEISDQDELDQILVDASAQPVVTEIVIPPLPSRTPVASVTPAAKPPRRRLAPRTEIVIGILAGVSVGLLTSVVELRREHQHVAIPMAMLSADVTELRTRAEERSAALDTTLTEVNKKIEDTRAEVAEARSRLEKQEIALAKTAEQVDEVSAHQRAAEQVVKDHDAREPPVVAAPETRPKHLEKGVADGAYVVSLIDALKIIDAAEPVAPAATGAKQATKQEKTDD